MATCECARSPITGIEMRNPVPTTTKLSCSYVRNTRLFFTTSESTGKYEGVVCCEGTENATASKMAVIPLMVGTSTY
jgi:hypothetical protein